MRLNIALFFIVAATFLWSSIFSATLNTRLELLSRGVWSYELKPPRPVVAGLMTSHSVWRNGEHIGFTIADGSFWESKEQLNAAMKNDSGYPARLVVAAAIFLAGLILMATIGKSEVKSGKREHASNSK